MMEVTIERSKWLRGEADDSYLLRPSDNKMCCLGFVALAFGYTASDIELLYTPADLANGEILMPWLVKINPEHHPRDTSLCNAIIEVNDNTVSPNKDRESILTELFKTANIDIKFVD